MSAVAASQLPNGNVLITLDVGCDIGSGAEVYDWVSGTSAATAKMTTDRGYNTTTLLPEGGVLIDGRDWTHIGGSAELYDPVTSSFTAINGMFPQSEELHTATPAFQLVLDVVDDVLLIEKADVIRAGEFVQNRVSLSARDSVHIAVMERHGIRSILSFDADFDRWPGLKRIHRI